MKLGITNTLKIIEQTEKGYLLNDDEGNRVLLPNIEISNPLKINDTIDVFVYNDKDNSYTATLQTPKVTFEHFAYLKVKDINKIGVFMDWGIPKDLLIPYPEQTTKMILGEHYLVFLFLDEETNRLAGSCIENDFLLFDTERIKVEIGDEVDLLVYGTSELGLNAIVNNMYKGLLFHSDIHKDIKPGDIIKGYVKKVRDDGNIDLLLEPLGYKMSIDPTIQIILLKLKENDGILNITDKSSPEIIKQELGLSKKAFKRGLGNLYKQKKITLSDNCIKLI